MGSGDVYKRQGPHLHYEVLVKGSQVNAMTLDLPTGRKLADTPDIMEAFLQVRGEIDAIRSGQAMTLVSAPAPAEDGAPILVADGSPPAP